MKQRTSQKTASVRKHAVENRMVQKRAAQFRDRKLLVGTPRRASGSIAMVKVLRQKLGVSQPVLSGLLGVSSRGLANWEAGKKPGQSALKAMTELDRLHTALSRIMKQDYVGTWLQEPNSRFEGLPPMKLIEAGQADRIWRMVWQHEANVAS